MDLEVDYPKFQFSSKPAALVTQPAGAVQEVPAQEIKAFMKNPGSQPSPSGLMSPGPISTAPSSIAKKTPVKTTPKNSSASGQTRKPPSVRQISNKVANGANELLAMLPSLNSKNGAASPKKKKSVGSKTPDNGKKRTSIAASSQSTSKPSIFASAVTTRSKAQKEPNSGSTVFNSQSSAATASFNRS